MSISSFSLSLLYLMLHFTMGHNEIEIVEQAALKQIATFGVCERVGVHTCVCVCVCMCRLRGRHSRKRPTGQRVAPGHKIHTVDVCLFYHWYSDTNWSIKKAGLWTHVYDSFQHSTKQLGGLDTILVTRFYSNFEMALHNFSCMRLTHYVILVVCYHRLFYVFVP